MEEWWDNKNRMQIPRQDLLERGKLYQALLPFKLLAQETGWRATGFGGLYNSVSYVPSVILGTFQKDTVVMFIQKSYLPDLYKVVVDDMVGWAHFSTVAANQLVFVPPENHADTEELP